MTQTDRIIRHMKEHGSIDPLTAIREYGIMRLASRICDIKKAGYVVKTETVTNKNRYGEPVRYARYSLKEG